MRTLLLVPLLFGATGHYTANDLGQPFNTVRYDSSQTLYVDDTECPHARMGTDLTWDAQNLSRLRVVSDACATHIFKDGFEAK